MTPLGSRGASQQNWKPLVLGGKSEAKSHYTPTPEKKRGFLVRSFSQVKIIVKERYKKPQRNYIY